MTEEIIEVIGIVKPDICRKRQEWGPAYCCFELECSNHIVYEIWCNHFIPDIRKGWKVRVIGVKTEDGKYLEAKKVERVNDRFPKKGFQLTLKRFTGVKNV